MKACLLSLSLLIVVVLLGSCQDPTSKAKRRMRDAHMDYDTMLLMSRERMSAEHLSALGEFDEEFQKRYAKSLDQTLEALRERQRRDRRKWIEMRPLREEELEKLLKGNPEDLSEAWRWLAR